MNFFLMMTATLSGKFLTIISTFLMLHNSIDRSNESVSHKSCDMEQIREHLRVVVFQNGDFLKLDSFQTPKGVALDAHLLDIFKVTYQCP